MKFLNKIILILLLAFLMLSTLILSIYSFALVGEEFLIQVQERLYENYSAALTFLVIFVLAAWILYPFFKRQAGTATISTTEDGEVNISLRAMNKIIKEVAYQEENVEVKSTNIEAREDGLYGRLSISVKEEENIPALTGRLQHRVKSRLHNITGANIVSVEILIENVEERRKMKEKFAPGTADISGPVSDQETEELSDEEADDVDGEKDNQEEDEADEEKPPEEELERDVQEDVSVLEEEISEETEEENGDEGFRDEKSLAEDNKEDEDSDGVKDENSEEDDDLEEDKEDNQDDDSAGSRFFS